MKLSTLSEVVILAAPGPGHVCHDDTIRTTILQIVQNMLFKSVFKHCLVSNVAATASIEVGVRNVRCVQVGCNLLHVEGNTKLRYQTGMTIVCAESV